MTLIAEAERTEDVGDAFGKFKVPVEDQAADVTALVSELYAVGSALREIDAAIFSPEYGRNLPVIQEDLELVRSSLTFDLDDIFHILGKIGNGDRILTASAYRQTWKDINYHFEREGRGRLRVRLERYRLFLLALCNKIRRNHAEIGPLGGLRGQIRGLLADRDRRPDAPTDALGRLSLEPPVPINRPRSYERERPPSSPTSSRDGMPPFGLESPSSPTASYSASTSQASTIELESGHWAAQVFRDMSTTPLSRTGDVSRCYGEHMPDAKNKLEEWEELLEMAMGGGSGLSVRLYLREEDHRARIFCKTRARSGGSRYSCLPLNTLDLYRDKSSLRLCRRLVGTSKLELWATLKFTTIERLVIFHSTLVALRSQDSGKPTGNIRDHELDGEQEIFGGQIRDDDYLHALRVLRDQDSKAVRLQASVLRGEMKRTPVWTAFITNCLVSPLWLRRVGPKLVQISELHPHVFSSEYDPPQTSQGEHILDFTTEYDATEFVRTIADLSRLYRRT